MSELILIKQKNIEKISYNRSRSFSESTHVQPESISFAPLSPRRITPRKTLSSPNISSPRENIIKEESDSDNSIDNSISSDSELEILSSMISDFKNNDLLESELSINKISKSTSKAPLIKDVFNDYNKYNPLNLSIEQFKDLISFKLLYIGNLTKFKRDLQEEKICYINDLHEIYNKQLTNSQYWIIKDIKDRNNSVIEYLFRVQNGLRNGNGISYIYNKKLHNETKSLDKSKLNGLLPYLFDFICIIDHKINMSTPTQLELYNYPEYTYISVIPITYQTDISLLPLVVVNDVVITLAKSKRKIGLNKDELISLFDTGKFKKVITINADDIYTAEIYLFGLTDFLILDLSHL